MSELIVGIDLGTTNSEIAIVEDGVPRVLAVDGNPILPSMVGLNIEGKLLVGTPARNQYVVASERTIKSIKRKMGQDVAVTLGSEKYRPQEISAMILRKLKEAAEQELGQPVSKAVITVPAFFNDTQRQATREAGTLAGLDVVRILNEPTAAALTYVPNPTGRERFLVYDLGGGTFDVSILQAESGIFEVLSSHGDTELGGDDFDQLLMSFIAADFLELYGIDLLATPSSKARVLRAAEQAKKTLSDHPLVKIEEEFIAEKDGVPLHLSMEIERRQFEELIEPLVLRTMDCVQKALNDARLTASQIERVVLVGGSTRTPMIAQLLEERLGQEPSREVHPDLCVALGAAVQGAIVAKQNVSAVLVDITPHTLGIKTLEYPDHYTEGLNEFHFSPIVKRNTPLPTSRSEMFCTVHDNQTKVDIQIFQGESSDVRQNHQIGTFFVEGLSRVPAGNQILVQLDLTLDGTLRVSAREKSSGIIKQITIQNALARFAVEEREAAQARLNRLWQESRVEDADETKDTDDYDDDANEADFDFEDSEDSKTATKANDDTEAVPQRDAPPPRFRVPEPKSKSNQPSDVAKAEAALAKAERLRPQAGPADQEELDRLCEAVKAALPHGPSPALQSAVNALTELLFYMEDE